LVPAGVNFFSREEIIAFGGIPEAGVKGARSSARIGAQANADDTQSMQTNKSSSFLSFSPDHIIRRANSLGVSLGSTRSEAIASAKIILDNELNRSITMLRTSEENGSRKEDAPQCLIVNRASSLCEDLADEEDLIEENILDIPVVNNRQRKKISPMIRLTFVGVLE
jgi:flagellar biosynthesis regulator FlaF